VHPTAPVPSHGRCLAQLIPTCPGPRAAPTSQASELKTFDEPCRACGATLTNSGLMDEAGKVRLPTCRTASLAARTTLPSSVAT